ncbi:unnamed protein product [Macrosiphum euphorbiae]|uniref:BACK domain-containing protein n=1 Tax=Macrosiphum euphorbiae TaxID=13131 RepID=A0AAV0Y4K6_9HEMI|nr:unnamed protein product [Macrosiphum euphorbiae]
MVTKENVQVLLLAANVLQLDYVNSVCAEFLQKQLNPSNCLGIRAFADLHNCTDLLSSSEAYIKQHFLEVAKGEDFLSLSSDDLVKLISSNDLAVPFEEKVFECVIKWVKHDSDHRIDFLPKLLEHVRLPLLKPDIIINISEEPLLNTSHKCKDYIIEALYFNHQKSVQHFTIPKTIRFKPRQFDGFQKVLLMFSDSIYAVGGGFIGYPLKSVEVFDVITQKWRIVSSMTIARCKLGVGVLNNRLYAVGGYNGNGLKSVEYYDPTLDIWTPVAEMSECRYGVSVGVLDGLMYAIGGYNGKFLKSVEVYRPSDGVWSSIADMNLCRFCPGVAVLDGLLSVGIRSLFSSEFSEAFFDTNSL